MKNKDSHTTAAVWDSNRMTVVNHLTCVSRYVALVVKRQKLNASIQQTCICTYNIIIQCSFPSCEKNEKTDHGMSPSSRQSRITGTVSRQTKYKQDSANGAHSQTVQFASCHFYLLFLGVFVHFLLKQTVHLIYCFWLFCLFILEILNVFQFQC